MLDKVDAIADLDHVMPIFQISNLSTFCSKELMMSSRENVTILTIVGSQSSSDVAQTAIDEVTSDGRSVPTFRSQSLDKKKQQRNASSMANKEKNNTSCCIELLNAIFCCQCLCPK